MDDPPRVEDRRAMAEVQHNAAPATHKEAMLFRALAERDVDSLSRKRKTVQSTNEAFWTYITRKKHAAGYFCNFD